MLTPEISLKAQWLAIIISGCWLLGIIYLIIKESLGLRSALGWLFISLVAFGISLYPKLLVAVAHFTGIGLPANALFLFGFLAVLIILFGHTLVITKLLNNTRALTQKIALYELENRQSRGASGAASENSQGVQDP
jgi:hypothetical protein